MCKSIDREGGMKGEREGKGMENRERWDYKVTVIPGRRSVILSQDKVMPRKNNNLYYQTSRHES